MIIKSATDLEVYKSAFELAMQIFELSKSFPIEERYALTDQIRRSSRSVCSNLREAWSKRRYEAHFISKLTDADGESNETDTWLSFAKACGYINSNSFDQLTSTNAKVGAMLGKMIQNPTPFLQKK